MCVGCMLILQPFYIRDLSICRFWHLGSVGGGRGGPGTNPPSRPRDGCNIFQMPVTETVESETADKGVYCTVGDKSQVRRATARIDKDLNQV